MPDDPIPLRGVERKPVFLAIIADAFVESGFRGMTTAELARRCEVRENELYRIWPSKKQMFLEAIDYVYEVTTGAWNDALDAPSEGRSNAERILDFQSRDHGKMRLYRIVFAGLMESDDKEIRTALRNLYRRFHARLTQILAEHRDSSSENVDDATSNLDQQLDITYSTWAIIGIGTIVDIQRELGLLSKSDREAFMRQAAGLVLENIAQR